MKWFLYNVLFSAAYAALLPSFLLRMRRRGGYRARMGDRFGRYPADLALPKDPIWIHAVSVGEVFVAGQLMQALRAIDPNVRFVLSTTSSTGWRQAEKTIAPGDALVYNPLDFGACVRRALDRIAPRAIIITETEIWPAFIRRARARGIPLFLVNARVSDRSAPRYRLVRYWFGEVLRAFTAIFAQSDLDRDRLVAAGADARTITVTGSFKFDVARRNESLERELADWIRAGESRQPGALLPGFTMPPADADAVRSLPPVLLGGSTWPGEDEALLRIYRDVLRDTPQARLVIVPRHFEKADAVAANIRAAGFGVIRRSLTRADMSQADKPDAHTPCVYLADTTGEMMGFYGLATVAFVGKSLCAHGSQNMIEPCLCGVPTLVGPYTENFRPVMSDLLSAGAILQVNDEDALASEILRLFRDGAARAALGERARAAVARRCGVVALCARALLAQMPARDAAVPAAASVRPPCAPAKRRSPWRKVALTLVLLGAYALTGIVATPKLRGAWRHFQKNATRRYSTFLTLAASSAALPWCLDDLRETYIRLATRDYGFAHGRPYRVERADGHTFARYRDGDYGGDVVTRDGWPVETGAKFKATRLLGDLIPDVLAAATGKSALPAQRINARLLSRARMKGILEECRETFGAFDLWCVGRYDYVVTPACRVSADRLMAVFDNPETFARLAEARHYAPADLYASYVGTDGDVTPAFADVAAHGPLRGWLTAPRLACAPAPAGDLEALRPSRLTPFYIRMPAGLEIGGAEPEAYASLTGRIAQVMCARRDILVGLDAAEGGVSTNALAHWSAAAQVNPRDPILQGLADTLDLEGRRRLAVGDVNGALHCYENRIVVSPKDVAAIHNFAVCLKKAGQMEMAARVFLKAVTMDPKTDEHRLAFVECAAAAGHEDAACRQLEVLMARHPEDARLKMRMARLLALARNPLHDESRAVRLAEEAVMKTKWRKRDLVQGLADVYIGAGRLLMGTGLKRRMRDMTFDE